jgi:hypothetical protein
MKLGNGHPRCDCWDLWIDPGMQNVAEELSRRLFDRSWLGRPFSPLQELDQRITAFSVH